jgi:hypothetical protein
VKTKTLNILRVTKNVLLAILISGTILEVFFHLLLQNIVALPDIWRMYNYVLAVIALPTLFGIAFLHKEKDKDTSFPSEKGTKEPTFFKRKIRSRGVEIYLVRFGFFALLGFICGVLFILSGLLWFNEWGIYGKLFRFLAVLFIIIYPAIRGIFIRDYLRWSVCIPEMVVYCVSGKWGLVVGTAVVIFMALCIIFPALFHFIHDWGFLFYLYF